jgi:dienelactone hydrolase
MSDHYLHLGPYSDLVAARRLSGAMLAALAPGPAARDCVRQALNFHIGDDQPQDVEHGQQWEADGVLGEEVSWSTGYGPRTIAWLLKPPGQKAPSPAILAFHDHGAFKFYGKEKIADGPGGSAPGMPRYRALYYGGRAFAHALARLGFTVLIHDAFSWGSRRFAWEVIPENERRNAALTATAADATATEQIQRYNAATILHENLIEKYCSILGTTFAAIVAYDDRVALNYLLSRTDIDADRIGCIGLSGGGARATMIRATSERIKATVVVAMMSTYEHLLDTHVARHSWLLFPHRWHRFGDWPDLAACAAPSPLLVQYDLDDELFSADGMRAADARIQTCYDEVDAPTEYAGRFYPGPHKFDLEMQEDAFHWLIARLSTS